MIPNRDKLRETKSKGQWHDLEVKKLSPLLRGITSKHHGDSYCLNCFRYFGTENKLQLHFMSMIMRKQRFL